jgi:hypothetical protein
MQPRKVFDCIKRREILCIPWIFLLPADNPMQSEYCSHIGLNSNLLCRTCYVGGNQEYKRSEEGFLALMEVSSLVIGAFEAIGHQTNNSFLVQRGDLRTVSSTLDALDRQDRHVQTEQTVTKFKELVTETGVKDPLRYPLQIALLEEGQRLRQPAPGQTRFTKKEVEEYFTRQLRTSQSQILINPLLAADGLDVHIDTPVEPLHTFLLGVVKYIWSQSVILAKEKGKLSMLAARLNSVNTAGLGETSPLMGDYMVQFSGGLIGKHFKALSQVMPFACYQIVPDNVFWHWLSIGRLGVLLWQTEIDNIDNYVVCT